MSTLQAIVIIVILLGVAISGIYLSSRIQAKPSVSYPISVTDDLGRNVTFSRMPEKIVSLVPSVTEMVFAVGAGGRIVGVTRYDNFPPDLVQKVKTGSILVVGGGYDPDVEKITAIRPDIIFVGGSEEIGSQAFARLQGLGFTLVSLDANTIDGVLKDISLIGKITGNSEVAQQIVSQMQAKINSIVSATKDTTKVGVYLENWPNPLFSVGSGLLQSDMITKCGGGNIFSELNGSVQVTAEAVIAKNPDVIIMFHNQTSIDDLKNRPGWEGISAVKSDRVFQMTGYEGAPNPRIADSLQKMCDFIHPELFGSQKPVGLVQSSIPVALRLILTGLERI